MLKPCKYINSQQFQFNKTIKMIVINRLCRSNSNKCLINYISTTVTSRCDKPKDEINKTERKDSQADEVKEDKRKANQKAEKLFESRVSEEKSQNALKKLGELKMSDAPVTKTINVTQVKMKDVKKRPIDEDAKKAKSPLEYDLVQSAKKVADVLGGDVNKTNKELMDSLSKVLNEFQIEPKKSQIKQNFKVEQATKQRNVKPENVKRKQKEAERLKGILGKITKVSTPHEPLEQPTIEFPDIIKLSELLNNVDTLNIFHPDLERNEGAKLKIWDELQRDELKYLTMSSPRNYYQELIKWTEEGKLWHFPINNEQGMDEEANVDFTEHVFLEDHLEPWCPKSGPLRHFMELVCVGLSKNPYLSVEDKREHIYWFRDYFEQKKRILQELGALAHRKEIEKSKETGEQQKTD